MKRPRFAQEQTVGVLKEHQADAPVPEFCRKQGITDATIYTLQSKHGSMGYRMRAS